MMKMPILNRCFKTESIRIRVDPKSLLDQSLKPDISRKKVLSQKLRKW